MKRIVILGLLCLILLAACASTPVSEVSEGEITAALRCQQLTSIVRACEFRLLDGTFCVIAYTGSHTGGVGLSCNWK